MSKINIFSTVVFPLIAAPINGAAIQYLVNIEKEDKKTSIPIIESKPWTVFYWFLL